MDAINVFEKLSLFSEHWSPKIIGEFNGQQIRLVKFKGEFVWHKHDNADELFYVLKGSFQLRFRDKTVELHENEFCIVPRGVEHMPVANDEVWVMLIEPGDTVNTGDNPGELTKDKLRYI